MTYTIKLSQSQSSALECRDWSEEPTVRRCWDGDSLLTFGAADQDNLFSEITEASNAEDDFAEERKGTECGKLAARACRSLCCVSGKVLLARVAR